MKLAEALILRADLQTRLEELRRRLVNNARVQAGEKPSEEPRLLLEQLDGMTAELEQLICRINLTNASATLEGESLTALLARRECMMQKVSILRSLMDAASETVIRGAKTEVKILSTVSVANLRKEADQLSRSLRELDMAIQGANWATELQ